MRHGATNKREENKIYQRSVKKISAMEQKATDTSFVVMGDSEGKAAAPILLTCKYTTMSNL